MDPFIIKGVSVAATVGNNLFLGSWCDKSLAFC